MKITLSQFKLIEYLLPVQRGNVTTPNIQVLNAILYVTEHGCKWRGLPERFGNWHTIYTRANRWAKQEVFYNHYPLHGYVVVTDSRLVP